MLVFRTMNGNDPVTCILPVDDTTVSAALVVARDFAGAAGLSADTSAKLAIIVEELVLNIIEHGGARGEISLSFGGGADAVRLTTIDSGLAYDPRLAEIPSVIPERGGGAGLALILAWARIVDYARIAGRNRLELMLLA